VDEMAKSLLYKCQAGPISLTQGTSFHQQLVAESPVYHKQKGQNWPRTTDQSSSSSDSNPNSRYLFESCYEYSAQFTFLERVGVRGGDCLYSRARGFA